MFLLVVKCSFLSLIGLIISFLWQKLRKSWIEIPFTSTGHCCFITGAGSGIGREIATSFAYQYAVHSSRIESVVEDFSRSQVFCGVLTQREGEELKKYFANLNQTQRFIHPVVCDVSSDKSVEGARKIVADYCQKHKLALKVVVNNAGISAFGFAECLSLKRFQQNMDVNFFGALRVSKAFVPILRANAPSRLLNHGSVGGMRASGFGSAYLCSKAAMNHLNECLREELSRFGVKVVLMMPGFFQSNLLAQGGKNGAEESDSSPEMFALYGDFGKMMAETARNIEVAENLNGPASQIAELFVEAATSRIPKARYLVGYDAHVIRSIVCYLPAWFTDYVFSLMHKKVHPKVNSRSTPATRCTNKKTS